jgi:hypothetical protein
MMMTTKMAATTTRTISTALRLPSEEVMTALPDMLTFPMAAYVLVSTALDVYVYMPPLSAVIRSKATGGSEPRRGWRKYVFWTPPPVSFKRHNALVHFTLAKVQRTSSVFDFGVTERDWM